MRERNSNGPASHDSRVMLIAVRPSARFHRLGGIGSLVLLYPVYEASAPAAEAPVGEGGDVRLRREDATDAA